MATIPIRADGSAANIAAATSGVSASTSLNWANLIADDANVSAGDVIELYSAGGSFTASSGVVLQVTADMSGALGNPVIIREAAGNTVSVISTGSARGIDFAAGCNYVEVDLDVTQQSTDAAVHASSTAGIAGDGYTIVYKGTVTGRAGAADDGDGISTDGIGTANRSELLLDGATIQDIRRITAAPGSPQSVTCHDDSRCRAINGTRILRSNTVYATGGAATANFEMTGGEITTWYGDGIDLNTNAGGNAIFNSVTITNDQDARLHVVTQNDQDGIVLYNQCTINISNSDQISQNNSGVVIQDTALSITDSSGFQFRCNRSKPIEIRGGSITIVGAKATQLIRIQGAGGRYVVKGVKIDVSALTSGGIFTTGGSTFGTDNKFINNKMLGGESGVSLTNNFTDADIRFNTFVGIGVASNSNRAVSVGETNGTSQVSDNIFSNCLGNNGCIFTDSGTPFIDRNNYSNGTADEGDELGSTTDPVLNSNNEPTAASVYQGARSFASGGSGSGKTIGNNIIG